MHDLFLSYRRLDAERVAPLVAALNARGVTVWQDANEICDNASIQRAINDGLANARALLVWYSKDYNASRACQWELTTAYCAAQASGGDPRRRVLVVNPEASPGHIVLPELFDQLHLNAVALPVDELAERITARLADHAAGVPVEPLGSLRNLARPAWHGSAGLGSLRFGAAYPGGVFWLRAFGYSDSDREMDPATREGERDNQIRHIATRLRLKPDGLEMVEVLGLLRGHFQTLGQPFLWIIDDLPPLKNTNELALWLAPHESGRTLITTRARHLNHIEKVEIQQLEPDETLRLLARGTVLSTADETVARAICKELGGHALAVDVMAPLAHDIGFAAALDMLHQPDDDALEFAAELDELLPADHQRSVAATFLASIKRLDEPARDLLRLASVLAQVPIPKELQSGALGRVDQASESEALKTAIRGRDQLLKGSLAENAGDGAITVHTLVVRTVRFHDGKQARVKALQGAAVEVLLTKMPQVVDIRTHEALKGWVAHARQASEEAEDLQTANLLGWVGRHDYLQGAYELARNAFSRELNTRRRVLGEDHPDTLTSMNNLGLVLEDQGDLVGARRYAEQVFDARRRVLGEDHLDTLISLNNLGQILQSQGDLVAARRYAEQVLDTRRRVLGENHPHTPTSLNNLGQILQDQGDLVAARRCTEQIIDMMERLLGKDHPDTLTSLSNLSLILKAQGDLIGARRCAEQALNMRRQILGENHPHTLSSLNSLGSILYTQGDLIGARCYAEQVLDARLRVLGKDHPDTLSILNSLGQILKAQGDLVGARSYAEQLLDSIQRIVGEEHPETLNLMGHLGQILQAQGDLGGAQRYAEQVLDTRRRNFGNDHPSTLTALNNLSQILQDQDDLDGARYCAGQVLDARRRVLGERHSDTTIAAWNLFQILLTLQAAEEAKSLFFSDLDWLLTQGPEQLGAAQRQIAGMVRQMLGGLKPD